jgi:predicted MFS family arabinose efflux permease
LAVAPVLYLALLAAPLALSANSTTTVIPDLAHDFGVSTADATWTATAFGWATVLGAPLAAGLIRGAFRRGAPPPRQPRPTSSASRW